MVAVLLYIHPAEQREQLAAHRTSRDEEEKTECAPPGSGTQ